MRRSHVLAEVPNLSPLGVRPRQWSPFDDFIPATSSGLYVPVDVAPRQRPKCVDLFCGAGGFSLGMIEGGFEVVGGVDNDPDAAITYLANLGTYPVSIHFIEAGDEERLNRAIEQTVGLRNRTGSRKGGRDDGGQQIIRMPTSGCHRPPDRPGVSHFWFGDIRKLTGKRMLADLGMACGELDCVVGGPPCQGFSRANGKRTQHDPRNSLVFEFARVVCELSPKTIVMENVPQILDMVTPDGIPVIDALCRVLADGGFGTYEAVRRALAGQPNRRGVLAPERSRKRGVRDDDAQREKRPLVKAPVGIGVRSPRSSVVQATLFREDVT